MTTDGLAIVNARVFTGDPRRPWADAVLMHGETLAAVGSSAEIRKRATHDTMTVDARGMTVVPAGLFAGHCEAVRGTAAETLRAGMPANLVLLDRALDRVDADSLRDARVTLAITAGRVVDDPGGLTRRP